MRTLGFATGSLWIVLGALLLPLVGKVGDAFGIRAGLALFVPSYLIGSLILASAGRTINADIEHVQAEAAVRAGGK